MSKGNSFAKERQDNIVAYINKTQYVSVADLARHFDVSISTIRNDLGFLADQGLIHRSHGGASALGSSSFSAETTAYERSSSNIEKKEAIARASLDLINDGDTIAVLAGTTLYLLAKKLTEKKDLTIVVNDIQIAAWLNDNTTHRIYVLGGFIKNRFHYMNFDPSYVQSISVDKAFFSTTGFDIDGGAMVPDINLASNQRSVLNKANQIILLCDSTKFHRMAFAQVVRTEDIDCIITDDQISYDDEERLKSYHGLRLIIAEE